MGKKPGMTPDSEQKDYAAKPGWKAPNDLNLYKLKVEIGYFQSGQVDPLHMRRNDYLNPRIEYLDTVVLKRIRNWLDSYDYGGDAGRRLFKRRWKYVRQLVDLQTRLLFEQCFYDRGTRFWRSLVSGFRPLD